MSWFARPGLVLFTENYAACIAFYRDALQLPVEYQQANLVRFTVGDGYLMVEQGGRAHAAGKGKTEGPVLRFNVENLNEAAALLRSRGVAADVQHWDWGSIAVFFDPDGNRCELRSAF